MATRTPRGRRSARTVARAARFDAAAKLPGQTLVARSTAASPVRARSSRAPPSCRCPACRDVSRGDGRRRGSRLALVDRRGAGARRGAGSWTSDGELSPRTTASLVVHERCGCPRRGRASGSRSSTARRDRSCSSGAADRPRTTAPVAAPSSGGGEVGSPTHRRDGRSASLDDGDSLELVALFLPVSRRRCGSRSAPRSRAGRWRAARSRAATWRSSRSTCVGIDEAQRPAVLRRQRLAVGLVGEQRVRRPRAPRAGRSR